MATYTYRCENQDCLVISEIVHSMLDDPKTKCPLCKKQSLMQVIRPSTFMLTGSDWHGRSHLTGKTKRFNATKKRED